MLACTLTVSRSAAQAVYYPIENQPLYQFLDELANTGIIDINSVARPYTRNRIAGWLQEASGDSGSLGRGQREQLDFYLRDFSKETGDPGHGKRHDLLFRSDSLFTLSINPVGGYRYWKNGNDGYYHRWFGAEAFAYVGGRVGFYASLRDNHESLFLAQPGFLTTRPGAVYKHGPDDPGGDFSESRGGITYAWKWGHAGIVKDRFAWGSTYSHSNIFSGHAPSFPYITFTAHPAHWFEFRYVHGFLVSNVLDTSRSYTGGVKQRSVFFPKFLAANIYTFKPWRGFRFSIGNSIVYADDFQLAYLVPVYFFKSVDHGNTNTGGNFTGQNSQMFFDINSRQLRYLNLYLSVFIDEVNIGNFWKPDEQSNFFSIKGGAALTHPVVPNTTFILEYTRTHPGTYKHFVSTTTFSSNDFNLGHHLRDNAGEIFAAVRYRPFRGLYLEASASLMEKGENYPYTGTGGSGLGLPYLERVFWKSHTYTLSAQYEIINDAFVIASFSYGKVSGDDAYVEAYTPAVMHGTTSTGSAGVRIGF